VAEHKRRSVILNRVGLPRHLQQPCDILCVHKAQNRRIAFLWDRCEVIWRVSSIQARGARNSTSLERNLGKSLLDIGDLILLSGDQAHATTNAFLHAPYMQSLIFPSKRTPMHCALTDLAQGCLLRISFRRVVSGDGQTRSASSQRLGRFVVIFRNKKTYLRSFSIKSTCVMIIRRQQYRLQPS